MKDTVTLTMIVKNEATNLEACLNSVNEQVDEIVIVDTGSTDDTLLIARRYTDKIYHYPWHGDFSAARNFALEKASGEWILYLDADEKLNTGNSSLKDLVNSDKSIEAYLLPIHNPTGDSNSEYNRFLVLRLFKNNGRYRFQGKIHEQIIVEDPKSIGLAEEIVIEHKRLSSQERNRKRGRNLNLLKKACADDSDNPFLRYYLGVEWLMLGKPTKALPHLQYAYQTLTDNHLLFRSPALRYLIICLKTLGRLDEAICLCMEADLRYPEYTDIHYLGGILFEEKKEYEIAVKWFNQAILDGTPPAVYIHMNGSGSFLAYYHLGYCHEKLGRSESARKNYEQALEINPCYIYPVYNLFLILLAQYDPGYVLKYLKEKIYWQNINLATTVARLYNTLGYPYLAYQCLEDHESKEDKAEECRFYLGKYSVYSGRLQQGLKYLQQVTEEGDLYRRAAVHRIIALILQDRQTEAKAAALKLWRIPESRYKALVLLELINWMEKSKTGGSSEQKMWDTKFLKNAGEILNHLSRYLPEFPAPSNNRISQVYNSLESIINSSASGYRTLLQHYRDKIQGVRSFLDYKIGAEI
ncbi:glycosyltransferase [Desulfolucanica intricata]|uniref:glycosyltransferase n=1 Tax=Desulfolucanica intricata TaxID=1285191 RepID=UPI00083608A9|nr:TPR domain-containing glycosyltransferase [Desulfolucanica intricata]